MRFLSTEVVEYTNSVNFIVGEFTFEQEATLSLGNAVPRDATPFLEMFFNNVRGKNICQAYDLTLRLLYVA